tara:strand:- start:1111 stop:2253 length:1143 start_codon:yes stop_codon:yes gene_type:complete
MNEQTRLVPQTNFAASRQPTNQAWHPGGEIYASAELFEREREEIFFRDWLCVARTEELANPGDYMTFRLVGEPIVVTRNLAGELKAFANVCFHRGVEVANGAGNTMEFSCPYHGWLYDLEGKLVGAPYMKDANAFDPKNCQLAPVRLDTWCGWVFVSFNERAPTLSDYLADLDKDFAWLGHQDFRLCKKFELEFSCNWKLIVENLLDFYHLATLHRGTIGRNFDVEAMKLDNRPDGRFSCFYERVSPMPGGQPLLDPIPAIKGKRENLNSVGFLPPNFNIVFRPDYCRPFVIWPITPARCRVVGYALFPEESIGRPGFAEAVETYHQLHLDTLVEDIDMVKSLQNACNSRNFVPGRMSAFESTVHNTLLWYLDRMFGPTG